MDMMGIGPVRGYSYYVTTQTLVLCPSSAPPATASRKKPRPFRGGILPGRL